MSVEQSWGNILVAVESTEGADEAIRQADARARHSGSKVIYCAAFPDLVQLNALFPRLGLDIDVAAIRSRISEELRERVASLTAGGSESSFDIRVLAGPPLESLIREAEREKARLIVVAPPLRAGVVASLRGTLAERIVRHADVPVLVARPRKLTGSVLAATDLSDGWLPALRAAADEVRRIDGRLTALHCIDLAQLEWINGSFTATRGWLDLSARSVMALRTDAEARVTRALEDVGAHGSVVVSDGDPATQIVRVAEDMDAEIVVVGTAARKGFQRMTMASVAESVVRDAPTSVLVVRLDDAYESG